jgi:hypothetical protein
MLDTFQWNMPTQLTAGAAVTAIKIGRYLFT